MGIPYGVALYDYDSRAVSNATANPGGGEVITQQHFAEDADINTIVRRFGLTGSLPTSGNAARAVYGDFTGISDYQSAVERIEEIDARFSLLPPQFREKFDNNPGKLVDFALVHSVDELEAVFGEAVAPPVVDPVVVEPS